MKKGLLLGEPNHQVKEVSGDGREEKKGLLLGKTNHPVQVSGDGRADDRFRKACC